MRTGPARPPRPFRPARRRTRAGSARDRCRILPRARAWPRPVPRHRCDSRRYLLCALLRHARWGLPACRPGAIGAPGGSGGSLPRANTGGCSIGADRVRRYVSQCPPLALQRTGDGGPAAAAVLAGRLAVGGVEDAAEVRRVLEAPAARARPHPALAGRGTRPLATSV